MQSHWPWKHVKPHTQDENYLSVADEFAQRVVDDFVAGRYQIREGITCKYTTIA